MVNDTESILTAMVSSLDQLGKEYHVIPVTNSRAALEEIKQRQFDLIITDLQGSSGNGIRFLEQVQAIHPGTRILIAEEDDSAEVKAEASRLNIYRYLVNPVDSGVFPANVEEVVGVNSLNQGGISILGEDDYATIKQILDQLEKDVGARCVFLTDGEGTIIAHSGYIESLAVSRISSLLSGSIASLAEAGKAIDASVEAINLAYSEGKSYDVYAINIGSRFLLIILIDRGPSSSRLGLVWYHGRLAASSLTERMKIAKYTRPGNILGDNIEQDINGEFDKLFPDEGTAGMDRKTMASAPTPENAIKGSWTTQPARLGSDEAKSSGSIPESSKSGSFSTKQGDK